MPCCPVKKVHFFQSLKLTKINPVCSANHADSLICRKWEFKTFIALVLKFDLRLFYQNCPYIWIKYLSVNKCQFIKSDFLYEWPHRKNYLHLQIVLCFWLQTGVRLMFKRDTKIASNSNFINQNGKRSFSNQCQFDPYRGVGAWPVKPFPKKRGVSLSFYYLESGWVRK